MNRWMMMVATVVIAAGLVGCHGARNEGRQLAKPYPARQFNSKMAFDVMVLVDTDQPSRRIGRTPADKPLELPACEAWWVAPAAAPAAPVEEVAAEVKAQRIPGLLLNYAKDADLAHLKGLTGLRRLNLNDAKVTDAGLEHLADMTALQTLVLSGTAVTDAGLAHLKSLRRLQMLDLWSTAVTGAGLEHLKGGTGLRTLRLADTKVADAGLEHLRGLRGLRELDLRFTKVTDAGLKQLKGLTGLRMLYLAGAKVTDAGVAELQGHLPEVKIAR